MDSKHGHLLLGYWSGLRARQKQLMEDDEDAIFAYLAPYFFVLDVYSPVEPVYWISGRVIRDMLGENPCSKSYYHYWDEGSRPLLRSLLEDSIQTEEPVHLTSFSKPANGQVIEIETVLTPIMIDKDDRSMLLGVSVPTDPARFRGAPDAKHVLKYSGFAYDRLRGKGAVVVQLMQAARSQRL
jgi:hypothetical protein